MRSAASKPMRRLREYDCKLQIEKCKLKIELTRRQNATTRANPIFNLQFSILNLQFLSELQQGPVELLAVAVEPRVVEHRLHVRLNELPPFDRAVDAHLHRLLEVDHLVFGGQPDSVPPHARRDRNCV